MLEPEERQAGASDPEEHMDKPEPALTIQAIQDLAGKYFPLARAIAVRRWRALPPGVEQRDDLIGEASVSLVACLHEYDPAWGTSPASWISFHVRYGITDYLRSLDPLPQEKRRRVTLVYRAATYLDEQLQRQPSSAEIASFLQHAGRQYALLKEQLPGKSSYRELVAFLQHAGQHVTLQEQRRRKPSYAEIAWFLWHASEQYTAAEVEETMRLGQITMVPLQMDATPAASDPHERQGGSVLQVPSPPAPPEHRIALQEWFTTLSIQEKIAVRMLAAQIPLAVKVRLEDIAQVAGVSRAGAGRLVNKLEQQATACLP